MSPHFNKYTRKYDTHEYIIVKRPSLQVPDQPVDTKEIAVLGWGSETSPVNTLQKLEILGTSAQDDKSAPTAVGRARVYQPDRSKQLGGISHCTLSGGRRMPILKTLFTNVCEFDCAYCEHRAQRDIPRVSFRPEELASLTIDLIRRKRIEGLFLSSGITRRVNTVMDRMIAAVEILRKKYAFTGYIHMKILPGADRAHVEQALRLASRVSLNLEAPSGLRLGTLSREKQFEALIERMTWIRQIQQEHPDKIPAGQITQFVVGPAGETDREILAASDRLYRELDVRRAYYSAFHPIPDTPLDRRPPTPLLRERRLYQADWLLRFYG
ncbi:MAG: radical SAM protein, partial [Nitrospirae bacterium]|nr:radical SAM protein [Nitrospirota bacterium]